MLPVAAEAAELPPLKSTEEATFSLEFKPQNTEVSPVAGAEEALRELKEALDRYCSKSALTDHDTCFAWEEARLADDVWHVLEQAAMEAADGGGSTLVRAAH